MKIISKKEAKERGLKKYFTGKPCKHGHVAERYVLNTMCKGCAKAWRGDNKEHTKQYYQDNKKQIKEGQKQYYQENKEQINAASRQYYQENKEQRKEYQKQNYQENKDINC